MNNTKYELVTDSQLGIYLECTAEGALSDYLIPLSFDFDKDKIDAKKLASSFDRIAETFSAFKTVIDEVNSQPVMYLYDGDLPKIEIVKISDAEVKERKDAMFKRFTFGGELLWRAVIFETETKVILHLVFQHNIFDGTSGIIFNELLAKSYNGEELVETDTMFDAKRKETEEQNSEICKSNYAYYEKYLEGIESDSNLTPDISKGTVQEGFSSVQFMSDVKISDLVSFAKMNGVTENMVFLAAFVYTLSKFNCQKDTVFSSVESGRFGGNYRNSLGMFVKSFPLRFTLDEEMNADEFVKYVKESFFDSLKHDHVKFSDIIKEYPGSSDVRYVYQGEIFNSLEVGGARPTIDVLSSYEAVSNFDFLIYKTKTDYNFWLGYNHSLYTKELMASFYDLYDVVLKELLLGKKLCDFILETKSCKKLMSEVNSTETDFDYNLTIQKAFLEAANKYPDNIAVCCKDKKITYKEHKILSEKIASYINKKGIGKDEFVAVLIPRNEYMSVCSMGVLLAGSAYQPLDITYPEERLNFMVKDSKTKLLIADRKYVNLVSEYEGDVLYTDEIDGLPHDSLKVNYSPDDAFLLIYTSGTTGLPKGCVLENKNMVALCQSHKDRVEISENSRVATVASFGFDAGAMDIIITIMVGATLYVIPDEVRLDLPEVEKFYVENGITNGFMTTQLGRMFLENTNCKSLRHFILGGEKLVPFTPPKWVTCLNGYGPSETLAYVCGYDIKDNGSLQPIGKPTYNTKLYIVDSKNRILPTGCAGELCISGLQVGREYFQRPEKTAEVFVSNPFTNQKGYERLYKTGDVVRQLPDGNYEFIGRRDGQIKIRGFRIELTEVEQVIREYKGIKNATVQAFDDPTSGKFLAAYVVSDENVNIDDLNAFILERKPPYMVPAVTMQIDSIPVNANSKVDKKKLPKPERKFEKVTKPQNDNQQKVFDIVSDVVGTSEFGIETDLYLLGLSSIGSIKLCSLLAESFDISIQIKDIKQNNTILKLEEFISSAKSEGTAAYEKLPDYPLTKTQEGIFVECMSKPESTVYNIPLLLKISNDIDIEKLKSAIVASVGAHAYLKTELFMAEDGSVRQRRMDDARFLEDDIEVRDINSIDDIKGGIVTPFELVESRLFRIKIFKSNDTYLFIEIHHIISDGTSILILLDDIEKAYAGENIKSEAYTSFDLAFDEEKKRKTEALSSAKDFYEKILDGLDMNFLIEPDRLQSKEKDSGSVTLWQSLADVSEVKEYCSEHKISVNGLLCGAFGFTLAKYAGTEYSVFNTVYNGRNDSQAIKTFGMLVKTLPVVCNIEKEDSGEISKEISGQIIDSMANDLYSFAEISKNYGVKNDVIFIYQGDNFEFKSFCGEEACEIPLALSESKAPITIQVVIENNKFKYIVDYNSDMFTEKLIKTFVMAFDKVVKSFVLGEKVKDISLVTEAVQKELDIYNKTEQDYDTSMTIVDHFIKSASLYPDKPCVVYEDKKLTYREVEDLTRRIASYLRSKGIGKGDIVSILIHRDENMVISAHGAVRSGAAYLGLDPTYPQERLNFMIEDSESKILIADRSLISLLGEYKGEILYTDEFYNLPEAKNFENTVEVSDRALVVYSSGTTGKPKGAMLTNGNIVCFFNEYISDMELSESSNIATYASFGFDGGAMDVFSAPMVGATLYVIPDEIRLDLEKLEQFYVRNSITSGFMTTQVGSMFIGNTKCRTLKHLMVGGEKIIPVVPPKWITFHNGYGPSETMCYVNNYKVVDVGTLQPIGKVSKNVKEYILDKFGNRMPFGACGELCISGGQTGLGYLKRPEKTAEAFVANPFNNEYPYDRMYKTGDIVRQLPDGNYVFVGRRDGQVKIRGFRVELSEIEQQIRKYAGIENATVAAFDSPSGGKFLAAYIISKDEVDIAKLNEFISNEKPDYMVPAITMQIDDIPLTSNGKVDKKKLPKPTQTQQKKGAEPANETEEAICEVFEEVLGAEKVYADEDFFAIGGSSISAIQVVVKCNKLGYDIVFKNLFTNPTPHLLADFINNGLSEDIIKASEADEFDYSCLDYNVVENVKYASAGELGTVLLTGVTGFLGSHILKELLDTTNSNVICLVRSKDDIDAETRFQMMMTYYFEDWYKAPLSERVTILEGELGDSAVLETVKSIKIDTIINSAANVKHFAAGDELLKDNFSGVQSLIDFAQTCGARLIQISSTSVSGESKNTNISESFLFCENHLNIGQTLENKYVYSKYQAEQAVVDAISRGIIKGKVIRLGNLMARIDDSEFQINANSNGFLRLFSGYFKLGMFPVDNMDEKIEFSPIDSVAKAVVLLSGTPDEFTVFHAKNCNTIHHGYLINAMKKEGIDIKIVEKEMFANRYNRALEEEDDISDFSSFVAYLDNRKSGKVNHQIESSASFTTKVLYRLGFAWPLVSDKYLERMIRTLIQLGFFSK